LGNKEVGGLERRGQEGEKAGALVLMLLRPTGFSANAFWLLVLQGYGGS
jgi:hypothetical protein